MKSSTTTPRTPRKTSAAKTTAAKTTPTAKKVAAPRVRRAAPKASKTAVVAETAAVPTPTVDAVRLRAYEIFLQRHDQGDALSDWLQAERELMAS